ncbi:hypothetical protein AMTRI_Chr05g65590 [Amborella trichopoda]|uniref:Uncharacterized protein n=1 Tax=Amborella trichopoda TaxID=13333 RepID=W1P7X4_AMBTC|nr:hypothetical protein AMTR_s00078p00074610 [Amborella trichopoda]
MESLRDNGHQGSKSFDFSSSFSSIFVSVLGLGFFAYNAQTAASRAGNKPWINFFFIFTFLNMALLDFLLILHSGMPDAFERWNSLRTATLGSIIALTAAFLVYLWISVPPALVWVVWVACGITLLSGVGMAFMCKSLQESAVDEKPKPVDGAAKM